ncbi:GNAT family N-acetyltransferase [Labedaea rhizosphaerae]|uniref:Ribosomal protein S18 acetylase RimI-like enzyme n=1 Tax=Labedaea rhizosphaerae TaxID=598644 RepID=A0A4R6SMG8_LABRH|nr:GNAT family N-acetyltransferase [Labedaea rhizosphaerae]TDQ04363.1 ribosomal protein S18 acetylase RimI-like enzyme [Labedaea rhizosphaerae]
MPVPSLEDVPGLVAHHVRASLTRRDHERVGPFVAAFDPASTNPWRNYAVPDDGAQPTPADVAALIALFEARGLVPRLEYVPMAAPAVETALTTAGFTVEGRPPVMVSWPGSLPAPECPTGTTVRTVTSDAEFLAAATVQNEAYKASNPPTPSDVGRLRSCVDRGGFVGLATQTVTGSAVGSGLLDVPIDGIGELAAVGVLEAFRCRGIATALSLHLATTAHAQGLRLVWLEAAPEEENLYRRAGFVPAASKLWISRP